MVRYLTLSLIQIRKASNLLKILSFSGCLASIPASNPGIVRVRVCMRGVNGAGFWLRMCLKRGCNWHCVRVTHMRQGPGDGASSIFVDEEVLKVINNVSHDGVSKLSLRGDEQVLGAENRLVPFVDVVYLDVPQSQVTFNY